MNREVEKKLNTYPVHIRERLNDIRALILEVAESCDLGKVEETLKWGEPSYLVKHGSTVRFDWKAKTPDQYAVYFNCNTKLVDTFKELYGGVFRFEGNRAIVFDEYDPIPRDQLKHCIELSLKYHKVKHLPLLGA